GVEVRQETGMPRGGPLGGQRGVELVTVRGGVDGTPRRLIVLAEAGVRLELELGGPGIVGGADLLVPIAIVVTGRRAEGFEGFCESFPERLHAWLGRPTLERCGGHD